MFPFLRYKKNGLPYALVAIHESLLKDMFLYFEKSSFVRKKRRAARKAVNAAVRFAKKKKTYPSSKTAEALNVLGEWEDEIEYTHKVIQAAFKEAENTIKSIRREKIEETMPLLEKAREQFKNKDLKGGIALLTQVQEKLKTTYLKKTRMAILGGFSSEIKEIKHELRQRMVGQGWKAK